MSQYHAQWDAAKSAFERSTGANKPAAMGKVPIIGIKFRKGTHIDDTLKKIDKRMPANLLVGLDEKRLSKLQANLTDLNRYSAEYLDLLEGDIRAEKNGPGGKADSAYRDLKILKATLLALTARIDLDTQKLRAANMANKQAQTQVFLVIVTAAQGLRSAAQDGVMWGQQLLQRPDPASFNNMITTKARNITQPLANLRKWTMPEQIGQKGTASREKALADSPQLLTPAIEALYHQVIGQGLKDDILALLRPTGAATAVNASLEELGDKGVKLPGNSSAVQVVQATKHFMAMAKASAAIADKMEGIPSRIRIPDALAAVPADVAADVDPHDIPPNYQAPLPPPRRVRADGGPPLRPPPVLTKPLPKPPMRK